MTAPFTASNGWTVLVDTPFEIVMSVIDPDGLESADLVDLNASHLRALVEYAATIGITAAGAADPVTESQRAFAARIRVAADRKAGRKTEKWVHELAQTAPSEEKSA